MSGSQVSPNPSPSVSSCLEFGFVGQLSQTSTPVVAAASYNLYRGADADLPALLDTGVDSCRRASTTGLMVGGLTETPAQGFFTWWLVVAENGAGEGPAGAATAGPRVLDSSGPCP
jgi:hypothetical protein